MGHCTPNPKLMEQLSDIKVKTGVCIYGFTLISDCEDDASCMQQVVSETGTDNRPHFIILI